MKNAPSPAVAKQPKVLTGTDKNWDYMKPRIKGLFLLKLTVMICSAGFIFGSILTPPPTSKNK